MGKPTDTQLLEAMIRLNLIVRETGDGKGQFYVCQDRPEGSFIFSTYGCAWNTPRDALIAATGHLDLSAYADGVADVCSAEPAKRNTPRMVRKHEHPGGNGKCVHCGLYPTMLDCVERPDHVGGTHGDLA